jgi:hypothetical protein
MIQKLLNFEKELFARNASILEMIEADNMEG